MDVAIFLLSGVHQGRRVDQSLILRVHHCLAENRAALIYFEFERATVLDAVGANPHELASFVTLIEFSLIAGLF